MSAEAVRLLWERMEARDWEGVAAQLPPDAVVDWPPAWRAPWTERL